MGGGVGRVDRGFLESTLADLVAIDSRNPALAPGAPGEAEIGEYLVAAMEALGLAVETVEPEPGRPSVVGRLTGAGGGRALLLDGHIDTVDAGGMERPFEPRVEAGRLHGRGSYDMKGSIAAMLAAAKALAEGGARLAGDLIVAAVADEEVASVGTAAVLERVKADGAIVTEPTELELCVAHKGFVWLEVETRGRAAHGSRFEEGVDANLAMGRVLAAVAGLEADLRWRDPHPLLGPPSLHVGRLEGGNALSVYAARCVAGIERRTVPGETPATVEREIDELIDRVRSEGALDAERRTLLARDPFAARADSPVAATVESAASEVLGSPPPRVGATYWMDAALCAAAGIDTVVIGPAGEGAHADVEWVDLDACARLAEILARAAVGFCGRA